MSSKKRTIQGARDAFDALAGLSPQQSRDLLGEIRAAERLATGAAEGYLRDSVARLDAQVDEAEALLTQVDSETRELADAARTGLIDAPELGRRYANLRDMHRRARAITDEVAPSLERLAEVERDPLSFGETLFQRFPSIAPRFSF